MTRLNVAAPDKAELQAAADGNAARVVEMVRNERTRRDSGSQPR